MFGYIIRRLISAAMVLIAVSMMVFALFFYGPSDPALAYCPENRCTPERLERISERLGLDEPVAQQYAEYMAGIFVGREIPLGNVNLPCDAPCLGYSFKFNVNVFDYLAERVPASVSLATGAAVIFLFVGLAVGIFAARRRGQTADKTVVGISLIMTAIPYYLVALLAYLYLVSEWGIFSDTGYFSPLDEGVLTWMNGLLLPWLVLGLVQSNFYSRYSRGSMIEALNEDFVRTARAKGLPERRVTFKHALRAAIVPVVTIFGLDFAALLAGTVFTEQIFSIEGIGKAALDSIGQQDLPIISATVLIAATFIVLSNIIVDIVYSLIDPRVRLT
jgi:peptide/nickel transport system permease protein